MDKDSTIIDNELIECDSLIDTEIEESEINNKEMGDKVNLYSNQIKTSVNYINSYINASSFSKMIKIHATLGRFKNVGLLDKCKLIVKLLLRCIGINKKLYLDSESMGYQIAVCLADIQNSVNMLDAVGITKYNSQNNSYDNKNQNDKKIQNKKEIIVAAEPKVSILLPVYNHANFIKNAIESIQNQTYKNWELIIINDGSTDNLLDILNEYTNDKRIHIYTQENQRLPNTLTNLHHLATGQFVTWTSADNVMEPEMIQQLSKNLVHRTEAAMVFGDVCIIDDKDNLVTYGYREMNRDKEALHVLRLPHAGDSLDSECDNYVNACFMYRMEVANAIKGEYAADLEGLEDYDFWLRIKAFGKIIHIQNKEPLYRYRVHDNTMSEDLLKNKLEEHMQRSNKLMEYNKNRNNYININWKFIIENEIEQNEEFVNLLKKSCYNYNSESEKIVKYILANELINAPNNALYIVKEKKEYKIYYKTINGILENRANFYEGFNIPLQSKKVRQTSINGLYWEYPTKFLNKKVIGCHINLNLLNIQRTIELLQNNSDILFSFCATKGGKNKLAEKEILKKCDNAIFIGEKELGTEVFLYASWDMSFIPPVNENVTEYELMPYIMLAWYIGKWVMIDKYNQMKHIFPLVCTYIYNEKLLGIKYINNINEVENLLNNLIDNYSKEGVILKIIKYLNGIGQDIFVPRPDFQLVHKIRKCPTEELFRNNKVSNKLKEGYIAILVDRLDRGGLEQVVALLVREWIRLGINVKVFCTIEGGLIAEQLKYRGIEVIEFRGQRDEFLKYLKENKPILINSHYAKNMLDIVKKCNILLIEVIHNMYVFQDENAWKQERENSKYFCKYIAVSELVKEIYIKKHGDIEPNKIEVVGNAASTKKINGHGRLFVRNKLNIPEKSIVFINVSSMDSRKNQLGLITAFNIYHETINSDSYLILVGNVLSEYYNNCIINYINELPCKDFIIKLDYHYDIAGLYNASDVFVMPSYFEGWSIAATEALYNGLPLIHSRCGSALELIDNGKNGIMISNPAGDISQYNSDELMLKMGNRIPDNTQELVESMEKITNDIIKWKSKRSFISSNAIIKFSTSKMIMNYIQIFEKMIL